MKVITQGVVVTPVDEFDGWKREGERKLAQLINYREGAVGRLDAARAELAAIDAAIDQLGTLLGAPGARTLATLEALLLEAAGDFADTHPIQERIRAALKLGVVTR